MLLNTRMQTVEEIRRDWLLMLIDRHGSIANLNTALGRTRTDSTLAQIKNMAKNSNTGKIRGMGSDLARDIEQKLGLEVGTLDHPCAELKRTPNPESFPLYRREDVSSIDDAYANAEEGEREVVNAILFAKQGYRAGWMDSNPLLAASLTGIVQHAKEWAKLNRKARIA